MVSENTLSASLEDYLEAIYHIVNEKQVARVKDITRRLKVKASSVTGALRSLSERDLVNYMPYEIITLTPAGREYAMEVVRRHEALRAFFIKVLSIEFREADAAACEMEHCITKHILERFISFVDFVENCPRAGNKWIRGFGYYCDHDTTMDNCERCMTDNLKELLIKQKDKTGEEEMILTIKDLVKGDRARIVEIRSQSQSIKRLMEMGMTVGTTLEVERVAPLGDPIDIKLKGYHLSVRKNEAEGIYVRKQA
jgi:DtxR family transcriptional regulator, Mn-dependent transcriptional regulator